MKEKIVNLFLFVNGGIIREIGVKWHERAGSDAAKIRFLQSMVDQDWKDAYCHLIPFGAISYERWLELGTQQRQIQVLEETVFRHYKFAPKHPLMAITAIVDGKPRIDGIVGPPT